MQILHSAEHRVRKGAFRTCHGIPSGILQTADKKVCQLKENIGVFSKCHICSKNKTEVCTENFVESPLTSDSLIVKYAQSSANSHMCHAIVKAKQLSVKS
jgi:hypothetical protein